MRLNRHEIQALAREIQRKGKTKEAEDEEAVRTSPEIVKKAKEDYDIFLLLSEQARAMLDRSAKLNDFIEAHVDVYKETSLATKSTSKLEDEITLLLNQVKTIEELKEKINPLE